MGKGNVLGEPLVLVLRDSNGVPLADQIDSFDGPGIRNLASMAENRAPSFSRNEGSATRCKARCHLHHDEEDLTWYRNLLRISTQVQEIICLS